jgi:hypothetical protein
VGCVFPLLLFSSGGNSVVFQLIFLAFGLAGRALLSSLMKKVSKEIKHCHRVAASAKQGPVKN